MSDVPASSQPTEPGAPSSGATSAASGGGSAPTAAGSSDWWSRRRKWSRRIVVAVPTAILLYTLVGFFGVPLLLRHVVVPWIGRSIDGTIALRAVQANPYTFDLGLDGFEIADAQGRRTIAFDRVEVNFELWRSLFRPGWHMRWLHVRDPFVFAEFDKRGVLNLAALVKPDPKPKEAKPLGSIPHVVIDELTVGNGALNIDDHTLPEPFALMLGGLSFSLDHLDTSPEKDNPHHLRATTETGAVLVWDGTLKADPLSSQGTLTGTGLVMSRFMPYAMRYTDARVVGGTLDFELRYDFAPVRESRVATFDFKSIALDGVAIEREKAGLATLPKIRLEDVSINAITRVVSVKRVALEDGTLLVDRDGAGDVNLARMLVPPPSGAAPGATTASPAVAGGVQGGGANAASARVDVKTIPYPFQQVITALSYLVEDLAGTWSIELQQIAIARQSIDFVDRGFAPRVELPIRDLALTAGPILSGEGFRVPYATSMRVGADGSVASEGAVTVRDRSVDARVKVDGVELSPGAPYLAVLLSPPFASPTLRSSRAFVDAHITASVPNAKSSSASWSGEARLENSVLDQGADSAALASADRIALRGDATVGVSETDGSRLGWKGLIEIGKVSGDAAFLTALGLGSGRTSVESLSLDGEATASRSVLAKDADGHVQTGRDLSIGWNGTITLAGVDASRIELAGPVDAGLGRLRLAGAAQAMVPDASRDGAVPGAVAGSVPTTASWQGTLELEAVRLAAPHLAVDAKKLVVDGTADASRRLGADSTVRWKGRTTVDGGTVRAAAGEPSEVAAGAATLSTDGTLEAMVGAEMSSLTWSGALDGSDTKASGADWSTGAAALALHGDAKAAQPKAAAMALTWNGRVEARQPQARATAGGGPAEVRGETLIVEGALGSDPGAANRAGDAGQSGSPGYSWKGRIDFAQLALDASGIAGGVKAGATRLTVGGDATMALGEPFTLVHRGPVEIDGATADAAKIAGALNATLKALRLDGALDLRGSELKWSGDVDADGATARAGDVGGPMELAAEGIASKTTLGIVPAGGGTRVSWSGDATLKPTKIVSGAAAQAAMLGVEAATLGGDLTLESGATTAVEWKGALKATRATVERAGEEPVNAALEALDSTTTASLRGDALTLAGDATLQGPSAKIAGGSVTAGASSVALRGIDYVAAEKRLGIGQLLVEKPSIVGDVTMMPPPTDGGDAPRKEPKKKVLTPEGRRETPGRRLAQLLPFALSLKEFRMSDGIIELRDGATTPPTKMIVDEINATAADFATTGQTIGQIEAKARVQGSGRFEVGGRLDPFRDLPEADVKMVVTGVPLPPYSAFSGRYIGYRIENGRASTTLPMTINAGKVKGELEFLLDKMKLGDKVQSPDAPNIPIPLGLALLRDQNDQIKGKVPFSGDVTDPEFSLGGLIWQAVLSLFAKIITAPFTLIASAFGGAENMDLSFVAFDAGKSDLSADGLSKVDVLGKGMTERPQLAMEIVGHINREADVLALRPNLLREEAKRRLRSSFPTIEVVPDDVYRQIVLSIHASLPESARVPAAPNGPQPAFEQVEKAVLATMEVTEEMLRDLAARRAQRIADVLLKERQIAPERVKVSVPEGPEIEQDAPKATFKLQ